MSDTSDHRQQQRSAQHLDFLTGLSDVEIRRHLKQQEESLREERRAAFEEMRQFASALRHRAY